MVTMRQCTLEFRQSAVNLVLVEGNHCVGRIDEREDQENQVAALRLKQSTSFRDAIIFRLDGLDLYPRNASTHPDS